MMMKTDQVGSTWFCTIYHAGKPVVNSSAWTKEAAISQAQAAYDAWKQGRGNE